jgi:hypothetical protein
MLYDEIIYFSVYVRPVVAAVMFAHKIEFEVNGSSK